MTKNKKIAEQFLEMIVKGDVEKACGTYLDLKGKHHNPSFPAGFLEFQKALIENHKQFPNKKLSTKHIVEEGDLVVVHSKLIMQPGEELVVVHLFRFEGGKIVEMWDCGQEIPLDSPNKDGAF